MDTSRIALNKLPGLSVEDSRKHLEYRLASRIRAEHTDTVKRMITSARDIRADSCAIIVKLAHDTVSSALHSGDDSNGDCIVVIARRGNPQTAFYRRSRQNMSTDYFHVDKVVWFDNN